MSDETDDNWPEIRREGYEYPDEDDSRDTTDDDSESELERGPVPESWVADEETEPGNELGTEGDEGWEDDMGEDNTPDRSTTEPDDLIEARPTRLICDECEEEMRIEDDAYHDCECGHARRVICVPAGGTKSNKQSLNR